MSLPVRVTAVFQDVKSCADGITPVSWLEVCSAPLFVWQFSPLCMWGSVPDRGSRVQAPWVQATRSGRVSGRCPHHWGWRQRLSLGRQPGEMGDSQRGVGWESGGMGG